jgi:hypothetical protein
MVAPRPGSGRWSAARSADCRRAYQSTIPVEESSALRVGSTSATTLAHPPGCTLVPAGGRRFPTAFRGDIGVGGPQDDHQHRCQDRHGGPARPHQRLGIQRVVVHRTTRLLPLHRGRSPSRVPPVGRQCGEERWWLAGGLTEVALGGAIVCAGAWNRGRAQIGWAELGGVVHKSGEYRVERSGAPKCPSRDQCALDTRHDDFGEF